MDIKQLAEKETPLCIEIRRYFHKHPELSSKEENTVKVIMEKLKSWNIETVEVEQGGVLGFIHGAKPGNTVLLRADIDALPIEESLTNGEGKPKSCVSEIPGAAHACGHDAHTAMLLTAAKILSENRDFDGTVIVCFERGEEATMNLYHILTYMEKENIKPDACFGIHNSPFNKTGQMQIQKGPVMAGMFSFHVKLTGRGGHGSRPDLCINPIDCFAAISTAMAYLRIREISPFHQLSYSMGVVESGTKSNVLPDSLRFKGTVRFYDRQDGLHFRECIERVCTHIAAAYNCEVEFEKLNRPGMPLINNEECAELARKALGQYYPEDIIQAEPWMGTETFPLYLQFFPGLFMFLSTNNPQMGITADVHTSRHDIDESMLIRGIVAHIAFAKAVLARKEPIPYNPAKQTVYEVFEDAGYTFQ